MCLCVCVCARISYNAWLDSVPAVWHSHLSTSSQTTAVIRIANRAFLHVDALCNVSSFFKKNLTQKESLKLSTCASNSVTLIVWTMSLMFLRCCVYLVTAWLPGVELHCVTSPHRPTLPRRLPLSVCLPSHSSLLETTCLLLPFLQWHLVQLSSVTQACFKSVSMYFSDQKCSGHRHWLKSLWKLELQFYSAFWSFQPSWFVLRYWGRWVPL